MGDSDTNLLRRQQWLLAICIFYITVALCYQAGLHPDQYPPPTFAKPKMKQPKRVVPLIHEMGTYSTLYPNKHRFAVHSPH